MSRAATRDKVGVPYIGKTLLKEREISTGTESSGVMASARDTWDRRNPLLNTPFYLNVCPKLTSDLLYRVI